MEIITSRENKKIKETRKLLSRKARKQTGKYLIEGFHLLTEAVKAEVEILDVFVTADKVEKIPASVKYTLVSDEVLKTLTETGSPQGLVAVVKQSENIKISFQKVLVLENVQDPGNVGTMIRTADAAGYDAVFTSSDTADIYSPKVMRSMQGSNFHLPIFDGIEAALLYDDLKTSGLEILVTTLSDKSVSYKKVQSERFALVMGNEGNGVSEMAIKKADQMVHIDMPGQAESLNVAIAAGILMFTI